MNYFTRTLLLLAIPFLSIYLGGCERKEDEAESRPVLYTSKAWMREPVAGRDMSAAYVSISNSGNADDRLVGARSDLAARTEIHESRVENGIAEMSVRQSVSVPAGDNLEMKPGEVHLMLFGLKKSFSEGDRLYISLFFEISDPITLNVPVFKAPPDQGQSE